MDEIDTARYVALTTFRKDGSPKATPVWITGSGGSYRFTTGADSWKVRRLRNDPRVEVRVSDMRGRVDPHATVYRGSGYVLDDDAAVEAAQAAVTAKYSWQAKAIFFVEDLRRRRSGDEDQAVAVHIDLEPSGD